MLTLRSAEAAGSRPARPSAPPLRGRDLEPGAVRQVAFKRSEVALHRLLHARASRCANRCSYAGREQGAIEALAWRRTEFPTFSPPIGRRRPPEDTGFNRIKFADPAQGLCHRL